ncbi:hypothetical protein SRHO_G00030790 [Serrasalmus rhombeus]
MSLFQVPPPDKFTFKAEDWPKWIKRFERFRIASGLETQADENQVNALIYAMGEEAEDILTSLHLSPAEASDFNEVKNRLDAHFITRRNVIFERAKFNQRQQELGESVDCFITALHCLAEHCGYGELHDEMVRDRLVVGLRDTKLSEHLQMDPELTLAKAVTRARQSEQVKKQQEVLKKNFKGDTLNTQLDSMQLKQRGGIKHTPVKLQSSQSGMRAAQKKYTKPSQCKRCGDIKGHSMQQCPAREAVCNHCKKKGHYARACRARKSSQVNIALLTEDVEDEVAFLGSLMADTDKGPWMTEIKMDHYNVVCKIDTGADVTAVPERLCSPDQLSRLVKSSKVLKGPGGTALSVKGKFTATLQKVQKSIKQDVYVVKDLATPLLGRPAVTALQLVARLEEVNLDNEEAVKSEFPKLFSGLGKMQGEYKIVLKPGAKPFSLSTPRRISLPLMPRVKEELNRMEQQGVISKVEQPTEWCAPMVVVPKQTGKVRICTDLTELNKSVLRERHPLPSVEHTLGQLAGARVFSKLDANSGFWQIPLSKESSLLTTFITPFGRYCYNRLCFGISSAPEHFQKRMTQLLEGLEGVLCQMDDVLIWGATQQQHDERLRATLSRLQEAGVTLNEKCEFSKSQIKFLGQIIEASGVRADPEKVKAVKAMREPENISEVRGLLGMINHLGKFLPHLAEKTRPLRDLLKKSNMWAWGTQQQEAFDRIKEELTTPPGLALYDTNAETLVSADASSYGLGAVLLQKQPDTAWKPIAYASRALTTTEQRYAQIEKEALASTWACERFEEFLLGKTFHIETDHKPLVPLLGSKTLDALPPRIQRLRMRLLRFSYTISHVAGKNIATADVLSRAPVSYTEDELQQEEIDLYVDMVMASLPATEPRLQEIRTHQDSDPTLCQLKKHCADGWPDRFSVKREIQPYLPFSGEFTVQNGVLLRGERIVIPVSLRVDIINKLHEGHLGLTKCRERAKQSVWWPGLSKELQQLIENCDTCARERTNLKEPMLPTLFPTRPWSTVGADMFQYNNQHYLIVVDYFSRFFEVAKMSTTTSEATIQHFKSIFARHGIPEVVRSDNGPQFSSECFRHFAKDWGFEHVTSSPRFPQSNGEAERAVRTIKNLLKKSADPYLALMAYRAAPLANGYSPTELLMGRKIRTPVPVIPSQLEPRCVDMQNLKKTEKIYRQKQKCNYDRRHKTHYMEHLYPGRHVWIKDTAERGTVVSTAATPRSYLVETPEGILRRNRFHLSPTPVAPEHTTSLPDTSSEEHTTSETARTLNSTNGRDRQQQLIQTPVRRYPKSSEKEKADGVEVFRALLRCIERSQAELLEVMEEKQKAAERQAEEFIKELEQEITELKRRDTELEQLSHTEDHLHLLYTIVSINHYPTSTSLKIILEFCTEGDHKTHSTVPIEEESGEKKTQLGKTQAEVQQMIQDRLKKIEDIKQSVELNKKSSEKEKADTVEVFRALLRCIERSQAELLEVMEEKQKAAERQAEEFIKELEQEITELKRRDTELEQLSHTEDHLHLLQVYPSLCSPPPTKNWTDVRINSHLRVETLRRALTRLQEELSKEMEKVDEHEMKRIQQYAVDVTLDPDSAHPDLILSDDGKQAPQKVGVFVDYEEGLVSFYDVESRSHIYSFTGQSFTEKLYPLFSPGLNEGGHRFQSEGSPARKLSETLQINSEEAEKQTKGEKVKVTQLGKTQAEVQQMIQDRLKKIEDIKQSVELNKKSSEKEKADSVEVFRALLHYIERSQAELLEVMEEKQKAAERQAEEFIKELEQEITELKRRDTELEQLSHTEDHLHLLQVYPSLCSPPPTKNWTEVRINSHLRVEPLRRDLTQLQEELSKEMEKVDEHVPTDRASSDEPQELMPAGNRIYEVMRHQNMITEMLVKQQDLSLLPKRNIPVFAGDPLTYRSFLRSFENAIDSKTQNARDKLFFLEQYTSREAVSTCLQRRATEKLGYCFISNMVMS